MFTRRWGSTLLTPLAVVCATAGWARAQDPPPALTVDEAVAEALRANPGIRAARLRAEAAAERVVPAGAIPDPGLSLGLMNRSVRGFSTDPMMAMNSVQLSQRLPWPGKLASAEARSGALSSAEALDAEEVEATVAGRVRALYYRLAYLDRAIVIMDGTLGLLRDLHEVAASRYAVGTALQQDVLTAQVQVARLTADIEVLGERRVAARARFNALLGRAPDRQVGTLELPEVGPVPDLDALMASATRVRAALQAAEKRVEAARHALELADRGHMPEVNVTLGYGQRPQYDDLVTVAVGLSLPLRRSAIQEPRRREAQALEAAATASGVDLYNETYASLAELRAVAVRAARLAELYRSSVIPQATAAVEAGLSAYRVGSLDFQAVLQSRMTVNQFEIESVRLTAEHHQAMAGIGALGGTPVGGER